MRRGLERYLLTFIFFSDFVFFLVSFCKDNIHVFLVLPSHTITSPHLHTITPSQCHTPTLSQPSHPHKPHQYVFLHFCHLLFTLLGLCDSHIGTPAMNTGLLGPSATPKLDHVSTRIALAAVGQLADLTHTTATPLWGSHGFVGDLVLEELLKDTSHQRSGCCLHRGRSRTLGC